MVPEARAVMMVPSRTPWEIPQTYEGYGNGNHNHGAVECDLTFREGLFRRFGDGKNNAFSRQGDKACLDLQEHSHGK